MDNELLGKRLQQVRRASGLTQAEMAEAIGLGDHAIVSKIEGGRRKLSALELKSWCQACGVPVESVLNGDSVAIQFAEDTPPTQAAS